MSGGVALERIAFLFGKGQRYESGAGTSPARHFDPKLESLRGIAAVAVVVTHSLAVLKVDGLEAWWLAPSARYGTQATMAAVISAVANAQAAILLFFMLSGYVLTLSLTADLNTRLAPKMPAYFVRRALRLLPAMWVSIVAFAAVTHLVPWSDPAQQASAALISWFAPPSLEGVLRNFAIVSFAGNPVTWTIYVEVVGSVAVVPMIALTKRLPLSASAVATIGLAGLAYWSWPGLTLSYLFTFHVGVVLALHRDGLRLPRPAPAFLVGFALCFLVRLGLVAGGAQLLASGLGCSLMLWATASARATTALSALDGPALRFLGRISYSVYLLQLPVIYLVTVGALLLSPHSLGLLPHTAIAAGALLLLIPVAWGSYVLIERPAMSLGQQLARAR